MFVSLPKVRGLVLFILLSLSFSQGVHADLSSAAVEQNVFDIDSQKAFDGKRIRSIKIEGLRRTREQAVRWLLSQQEGESFDAERWLHGIHKLYDTTVVYDIQTHIQITSDDPQAIEISVHLVDRWTLLPYGIAQSGGGSNNIGGGVFEANVLGYFGQLSAGYSVFNGVTSFDVNYFQEFVANTNYIVGADFSGAGVPVDLQSNGGSSIGSYTWYRQQEQILVGRKFEPKIRLFSYLETYRDEIVSNTGAPEVHVVSQTQYRIRPTLILGRSELTNFLEQGQEITLAPTSANFFGTHSYSQFVATYKKVFVDRNTNYAGFLNVGAMTKAPIPYLFHLGGFDTVRGFSTNRAVGRFYINNSLEYRPYLTRFGLPVIGQTVVQGCVFQDAGIMWNSSDLSQTRRVNSELTLISEGAGLRFNFLKFAGAIARIDLARTLIPNEGWGVSFGVGQFF